MEKIHGERGYKRTAFEAWLICKNDFDHVSLETKYDYGIEIISRQKECRIMRPIEKGFCETLYYWKNRCPLTPAEKLKVATFQTDVAKVCTEIDSYCREHKRIGTVQHKVFALQHINSNLGKYLDNELLSLETSKEEPKI